MATPNYEQIQSFGHVTSQLHEAAAGEFAAALHDGMTRGEVLSLAVGIAEKYAALGSELGAQWYDLCSELAGLDVDPAFVDDVNVDRLEEKAASVFQGAPTDTLATAFGSYLQNVINDSIRQTGNNNLWRDYERGMAGGKWARVPVGDTCAWCLMLASQGAWYLTEESAISAHGRRYHDNCNCIAVYHADADSIRGYAKLESYKRMYYDAENIRSANDDPRNDYKYPEELQYRIDAAKAAHDEKYRAGYTSDPWTQYNEDMIIMRYKYGLK